MQVDCTAEKKPGWKVPEVTWRAELQSRADALDGELARACAACGILKPPPCCCKPEPSPPEKAGHVEPREHVACAAVVATSICLVRSIVAAEGAGPITWFRRWASGSHIETAWRAVHAAEAALVMIAPEGVVRAQLPEIRAALATTLGTSDGRFDEYRKVIDRAEGPADIHPAPAGTPTSHASPAAPHLPREDLRQIKLAIAAASDAAHSNVRNYRNWLLLVSGVVIAGLVAVAIAHAADFRFIQIPQAAGGKLESADVAQIEAAGGVGGLLMAIVTLIQVPVYSGPYALPLWQSLVRIPAGAVAALVGAAVLQGQVVEKLQAEPQSGLLAFAMLFGTTPTLVLRLLDRQADGLTQAARSKDDPLKPVPKTTSSDRS